VEAYRALGIEAYHRPINDLQVAGRKIGGTGAARIGEAMVVVGSLIFDFNYELMARVLKVPSEKFRDKLYSSLQEYLTTMKRELGREPPREEAKGLLADRFSEVLGREIEPGVLSPAEEEVRAELDARFLSPEWTFQKGGMSKEGVKIAEGIRVVENSHKAPGGLVRATLRIRDQLIDEVALSGDFFFYPAGKLSDLEEALRGEKLEEGVLGERIERFLGVHSVEVPGVAVEDFVAALMGGPGPSEG
jgi:lipoate-protein ligase A